MEHIARISYIGNSDISVTFTNSMLCISSSDPIKCTLEFNKLHIISYNEWTWCFCFPIPTFENKNNYKYKWKFDMPLNIKSIFLTGFGFISATLPYDKFNKNLNLTLIGSGNIVLKNCQLKNITSHLTGSGNVNMLTSSCNTFTGMLIGSGNIHSPIIATSTNCNVKGSGYINCNVRPSTFVQKNITGSGDINILYVQHI
jgi:hypothetical protein